MFVKDIKNPGGNSRATYFSRTKGRELKDDSRNDIVHPQNHVVPLLPSRLYCRSGILTRSVPIGHLLSGVADYTAGRGIAPCPEAEAKIHKSQITNTNPDNYRG